MAESITNYGPFGWSIGGFLDAHVEGLDTAMAKITSQLFFLAEYRNALITVGVPGEIDVGTCDSNRRMKEETA